MARNSVWMAALALAGGCDNRPWIINRDVIVHGQVSAEEAEIENDLEVGGGVFVGGNLVVEGESNVDSVTVEDDLTVGGDINHGGDIIEILPPLPPPPEDDVSPPLLTATLRSDNGNDHFKVGDDVKLTVYASGGLSPYSFRCLWADSDFSIKEISLDPRFPLKVINSPGAGQVVCRVKSADGQQTDAGLTIYVE